MDDGRRGSARSCCGHQAGCQMEGRGMRWGWGCCVGVRGVCPPQAYRRPQVALHDLYVNDKDRQELAGAAL